MNFHIKNWDDIFPHRNHNYYGNHSNSSVLQAMVLEPLMLKHLTIEVFSDTKAASIQMNVFSIQEPTNISLWTRRSLFFRWSSHSNENFQLSRVACLASETTPQPHSKWRTFSIHFRRKVFIWKSTSPSLSENRKMLLLSLLLLMLLR